MVGILCIPNINLTYVCASHMGFVPGRKQAVINIDNENDIDNPTLRRGHQQGPRARQKMIYNINQARMNEGLVRSYLVLQRALPSDSKSNHKIRLQPRFIDEDMSTIYL